MKKYTIKQVELDYEFYDIDLLLDATDTLKKDIYILSNSKLLGLNEKWLWKIMNCIEDCVKKCDELDVFDKPNPDCEVEKIVNDRFLIQYEQDVDNLVNIVKEFYEKREWSDDLLTRYLTEFYREEYTNRQIEGYLNGEYTTIIHPVSVDEEEIEHIEDLYSGKYFEFHEEETDLQEVITYKQLRYGPKKVVADAFGRTPNEINLYLITGYTQTPNYQLVD